MLSAKEAKEAIGSKGNSLHAKFYRADGDEIELNGHTIRRHRIPEEKAKHSNEKYRYEVDPEEEDVPEADFPTTDDPDETAEEFRDTMMRVEEAYQHLAEARRMILNNPDIMEPTTEDEDDLWRVVEEERQEAVDLIKGARGDLVDLILKVRDRVFLLTPQEQVLLQEFRANGLENIGEEEPDDEEPPSWLVGIDELEDQENGPREDLSRMLIYGGHPDRDQKERLVEEFGGFDAADWLKGEADQRVSSYVERIRNGKYDVVFALMDFVRTKPMKVLKRACEDADTAFVRVPHGQSPTRVRKSYDEQAAR